MQEIFNTAGSTTGNQNLHDIVVRWGSDVGTAYKVDSDDRKTVVIADITDKYSKAM